MTTLTNLIKWVTKPKIYIPVLWYYLAYEYLFLLCVMDLFVRFVVLPATQITLHLYTRVTMVSAFCGII